ncbi:hypothetical protein LHGZ1_1589 [Laribacter hongkongensis]|uniref:Uncharacterized protein n=1 Tax=Laribacter hongkongensis TaxID=168471 RepID=A0A248LI04_9NEIS|nr:hypothetical protein LHGZ1_1589 [Laribacter hongkongensis]
MRSVMKCDLSRKPASGSGRQAVVSLGAACARGGMSKPCRHRSHVRPAVEVALAMGGFCLPAAMQRTVAVWLWSCLLPLGRKHVPGLPAGWIRTQGAC